MGAQRGWPARVLLLVFLVAPSLPAGEPAPRDDQETHFERKVRPVLAGTCAKCHGAVKASGGLRLDSREAMLKGGKRGPALVPGDPQASLFIKAVRHDDESLEMPPGKLLPEAVQADLAAWVATGANWPKSPNSGGTIAGGRHWAFEPLSDVTPVDDPTGWAAGPIDRFIAAGHRRHRLRPVPQANRQTLIRRATFDLIGLPPTAERVREFIADERPDAYEHLIDELLASPHYGERWGRYWLDLARYADTAGDNSDYPIPQAYLYRDYVIDAFNADVPYDRFLREQLAGDILAAAGPPADYARQVIATGFIAQAKRFGTSKLEDIHQIIEDTLNTTGQVVLGLSLRCARCHDHKFDPIPSRDYYALYGFFASTKYPFAGAEEEPRPSEFAPLILPTEVKAREDAHFAAIARLKGEIQRVETQSDLGRNVQALAAKLAEAQDRIKAARSPGALDPCGPDFALAREVVQCKAALEAAKQQLGARVKPIRDELARKLKDSPLAGAPVAYAVRDGLGADAKLQKGGNPGDPGAVVPRGMLTCLDAHSSVKIPQGTSGRLMLARWLTTSPASALTARVMVNRIWQHHFGKPIVPTPSDFGLRGAPPSHPDLLEWLAREFIATGWSNKAMHRKILLSKTYQLGAEIDSADDQVDTGNAWYWRFERRALDAESLRDTLLDLAGNLDRSRPGPHPFPPARSWRFTAHHQFKAVYASRHRSVYLMVQRLHPHPYLTIFNGPDASMSTAVRDGSTMPLQALFLLNSPFVHEQAVGFARMLINELPEPRARVELAYLRTYARKPAAAEIDRAINYIKRYEQALVAEGGAAGPMSIEAWSSLVRMILASNEFIFVE
jgi:hypothetical protein